LQDRHGFNRVDESGLAGINQLKELLANPPREVVEEIAHETNNPELTSELANERAEEVAHEFRRRNSEYLKCDDNWRSIVETLAHNFLGEDDFVLCKYCQTDTWPQTLLGGLRAPGGCGRRLSGRDHRSV
jgi:hypothetical protein